jgi:hypothetical protein
MAALSAPARGKQPRLPVRPVLEFSEIKDFWNAKDPRGGAAYTVYRIGVRCVGADPEVKRARIGSF